MFSFFRFSKITIIFLLIIVVGLILAWELNINKNNLSVYLYNQSGVSWYRFSENSEWQSLNMQKVKLDNNKIFLKTDSGNLYLFLDNNSLLVIEKKSDLEIHKNKDQNLIKINSGKFWFHSLKDSQKYVLTTNLIKTELFNCSLGIDANSNKNEIFILKGSANIKSKKDLNSSDFSIENKLSENKKITIDFTDSLNPDLQIEKYDTSNLDNISSQISQNWILQNTGLNKQLVSVLNTNKDKILNFSLPWKDTNNYSLKDIILDKKDEILKQKEDQIVANNNFSNGGDNNNDNNNDSSSKDDNASKGDNDNDNGQVLGLKDYNFSLNPSFSINLGLENQENLDPEFIYEFSQLINPYITIENDGTETCKNYKNITASQIIDKISNLEKKYNMKPIASTKFRYLITTISNSCIDSKIDQNEIKKIIEVSLSK